MWEIFLIGAGFTAGLIASAAWGWARKAGNKLEHEVRDVTDTIRKNTKNLRK